MPRDFLAGPVARMSCYHCRACGFHPCSGNKIWHALWPKINKYISCCRCCWVPQPCLTLCHPTDCSLPGFPVPYRLPELEVNPALKLRLILYEFNCTYIYPWWVKVLLLACNLKLSWQKCVCFCIFPLLFQPCFLVYKEKKWGLPWWSSGWRSPLQFHSLVQEDPTYCNQVCGHNYWVCAV